MTDLGLQNENTKCNTWGRKAKAAQHVSIWAPEYKVKRNNLKESVKRNSLMAWANTANNEAVIHSRRTKKTILTKQQENIGMKVISYIDISYKRKKRVNI